MKFLQSLIDFYIKISSFGHKLETGEFDRSFTNLQKLEAIPLPYLDFKLNLYHAYKLLSKFFAFNNVIDDFVLLVYDFDKRLIRESMLINVADNSSLIQEVISDPIPEDFNVEGEEAKVFQSIKNFIQNKYSIQIANMKIIDIRFMEKILNEIPEKGKKFLIRTVLEENFNHKIRVYPTSPLFSALERLFTIQSNDSIVDFFNNIRQETIPITFFDDEWYITFVKHPNLDLVISPPFEFGRISIKDHFQWVNFVSDFSTVYKKKFKSSTSYFINIDWCTDFLSDVCESEFPLTKLRFEYLLQRFLYFIKQNEEMWDVVPRPIIYNGYVRLLIRLSGFHINPRKLSYWSIPSNLTQLIRENFGPFDQIALILTNESRIKKGWILTLNKSAFHNLRLLNENEFSQVGMAKNEIIFNHLKSQYKSLKALITIDKPIVSQFWRFLFRIRNSKNPLKFISFLFLLGKLNNEQNFSCYPIMPWYALFKKLGVIKSFRYLNKLLYDFLEF